MKVKKLFPCLLSSVIAFALAVSAVGNLITGYDLSVHLWKILLVSALAALASAALFQFRVSKKVLLPTLAAVLVGILVKELVRPSIWKQMQELSFLLTSHYHSIYNWPVLGKAGADHVTAPLMLWATLVAICVNWHICRRKHFAVAIVPAVIPLTLCLMTADKVPATVYLYLLILGLVVLLITDWPRKKQPEQGMKMLLWSVLPVALALVLLLACNPQGGYINRAGGIQKNIVVWIEDIREIAEAVIHGTPIPSNAVENRNLMAVGPRNKSNHSVMLVNSPVDGLLYLRERDFDVYNGFGWVGTNRKEHFTAGAKTQGELVIVTYSVREMLCVPYYAANGVTLIGGTVKNNKNIQQYSYNLSSTHVKQTEYPDECYKDLPAETSAWATELVQRITDGAVSEREKIDWIQDYVRRAAKYDAATDKIGSGYTDFAKWFLEEGETGYCVHYATAAVVLLRAARIPARYVEGYIVDCEAGKDVVVSKQNAHAWVEYYDWYTQAWCILETTPTYPETERPIRVSVRPQGGRPIGWLGSPEETEPEQEPTEEKPSVGDAPTEETEPSTSQPEETVTTEPPIQNDQPQPQPKKSYKWIKVVLICLLSILCILLQGYVRIWVKRKLWDRGQPNKRTIWRWRLIRVDAKLLKQILPKELDDLAKKARFSQHEIQPEELKRYEDYRLTLLAEVAKKPWYQRLFVRWILAIG